MERLSEPHVCPWLSVFMCSAVLYGVPSNLCLCVCVCVLVVSALLGTCTGRISQRIGFQKMGPRLSLDFCKRLKKKMYHTIFNSYQEREGANWV